MKSVHGGKHTNFLKTIGLPSDHPPIELLCKWEKAIKKTMKKLMKHPEFKGMAHDIEKLDKPNPLATFTAHVWQKAENEVLMAMLKYLRKKTDLIPGSLVFDGIMIQRVEGFVTRFLKAVSDSSIGVAAGSPVLRQGATFDESKH